MIAKTTTLARQAVLGAVSAAVLGGHQFLSGWLVRWMDGPPLGPALATLAASAAVTASVGVWILPALRRVLGASARDAVDAVLLATLACTAIRTAFEASANLLLTGLPLVAIATVIAVVLGGMDTRVPMPPGAGARARFGLQAVRAPALVARRRAS